MLYSGRYVHAECRKQYGGCEKSGRRRGVPVCCRFSRCGIQDRELKDCTFRDNLAETAANAVRAFSKQSTTLDHCTVSRQTDNSLADVQARSGTLYIRNGNDIGDLLVTKGDRPTVDITLAAAEFKGDLTIGAGLTVTIHQNGFQGKLTGTVKNEGSIVWDPAQAE